MELYDLKPSDSRIHVKRISWRQKQKILGLLRRRLRKVKNRGLHDAEKWAEFLRVSKTLEVKYRKRISTIAWHDKQYTLVLPQVLSLRDHYDDVVDFLEDFRFLTLRHGRKVFLDFSLVKTVNPGACLVLVAEVYRARELMGRRAVHGNYPPDGVVRRRLVEMGFYDIIDVRDPDAPEADNATRMDIRFATSNRVDPIIAKELRMAFEVGRRAIARPARRKLFEGVKEAMNNAFQHAYPLGWKKPLPVLPRRWWLAGSISVAPHEMMVIFYDQGIGIPATLPKTYPEQFRAFVASYGLSTFGDAHIIKAATVIQRSGTKKSHRGYGLKNIKDAVTICDTGELRILSGQGEYVYTTDGSEALGDRTRPLGGTLIQWRVSAASVEEPKPGDDLQDRI
jgi:hypothetical protein